MSTRQQAAAKWRRWPVMWREPISYIGTCATEARWDAVLGGSRRRIDSMLGATDNEMRPDRPVPFGVAARRPADGGAVPARSRVGATRSGTSAPLAPRANAHLRGRIPGNRGPCSALRRAVCCVTLLDHIDIWPSSGAL